MRASSRRLLLFPVAAIASIAGCFDQTIDFSQPLTEQVTFNQASLNEIFPFDLSTQSAVQQHKGNIDSISLKDAELSVISIDPSNNVTNVSGALSLRPDGAPLDGSQDVPVGSVNGLAITVGQSITVLGSSALDAYFMSVIKGSLKGSVILNGMSTSSSSPTVGNFTLKITLHMSFAYNPI